MNADISKRDSLLDLVKQRRSIRRYTNQPIEREVIDNILKVALLSPSSFGQNPVEFVVIDDKKMLNALANAKQIGAPSVRAASAAIVVMSDKFELWVEDTSVASTYLLLAAEHYGLGACWNHIRGRRGQHSSSEEEIKQILNIPSDYAILSIVALGYKGETKACLDENRINYNRVHWNNY